MMNSKNTKAPAPQATISHMYKDALGSESSSEFSVFPPAGEDVFNLLRDVADGFMAVELGLVVFVAVVVIVVLDPGFALVLGSIKYDVFNGGIVRFVVVHIADFVVVTVGTTAIFVLLALSIRDEVVFSELT